MVYWDIKSEIYKKRAIKGSIENKSLLPILFEFLDNNTVADICDVGCGAGALYNILKKRYVNLNSKKYIGLDLSKKAIHNAKALFPETNFACFDIIQHSFSYTYDIIFSSEMLSHILLCHQESVIKKLFDSFRKLCLFSLKCTELEGFEDKKDMVYYVYPNYQKITDYIQNLCKNGENVDFIRKKKIDDKENLIVKIWRSTF